jgi:uncharacterized protein
MAFTTRAEVGTELPSQYLKQLCRHFRHKHPSITFTDNDGTIPFPFGTCRLRAKDTTLTLVGEAEDLDQLDYLERTIASHLERFGRRDGITVAWMRDGSIP